MRAGTALIRAAPRPRPRSRRRGGLDPQAHVPGRGRCRTMLRASAVGLLVPPHRLQDRRRGARRGRGAWAGRAARGSPPRGVARTGPRPAAPSDSRSAARRPSDDGLAVAVAVVARRGLDAVPDGVPEVEGRPARPRSRSSAATTAQLVVDAAADEVHQLVVRARAAPATRSTRSNSSGPVQQPVLDDLGEAAGQLARRQRGQRVGVHHHQLRLPDRADVVLALGQVHAGLAADRRVDHRQERRGHVEQTDAALVGGRDEAHQVAHHAAAEGHHGVAAPQARPRPPGG